MAKVLPSELIMNAEFVNNTSICVVTYNREDRIEATLLNLVEQFGEGTQILVLDNCSVDGTPDILRGLNNRFRGLEVFRSKSNLGVAKGRQFLWDKVKTPLILSLDDDVIIPKSSLNSMCEVIFSGARIAIVSPTILDSESQRIINIELENDRLPTFYEACFLIRKKVVDTIGGFDCALIYAGEGLDYALRLKKAGLEIYRDLSATVTHYDRKRTSIDWYVRRQQWLRSFCYVYWKNLSPAKAIFWSAHNLLAHAKNGAPILGLRFALSLPKHALLGSMAGLRSKYRCLK